MWYWFIYFSFRDKHISCPNQSFSTPLCPTPPFPPSQLSLCYQSKLSLFLSGTWHKLISPTNKPCKNLILSPTFTCRFCPLMLRHRWCRISFWGPESSHPRVSSISLFDLNMHWIANSCYLIWMQHASWQNRADAF